MADPNGIKHAVILSGGGAYGAFEVGVLKSILTDQIGGGRYPKITPSIYTGTSVGAVNAAVMVSQDGLGVPAAEAVKFLEDAWLNLIANSPETCGNGAYRIRIDPIRLLLNPQCLADPTQVLNDAVEDSVLLTQSYLRRFQNFLTSQDPLQTRALEFVDLSALISAEPLYRLIPKIVDLEAVRRSSLVLRIVAANWATGEVKVFTNKDMTDEVGYHVILASAAIPGFFPPQYIGGFPYVDGGVVMNTPLKCAIEAGGNWLHIIYLDPDIDKLPLKVLENTYNTLDRTILINNATVINEDVDTAAWINEGLDAIDRVSQGGPVTNRDLLEFIRVASRIEERLRQGSPYRKLVLHRYHPHEDPGGGGVGILNFNRERMIGLIEQGFNETVDHDCYESGCVLVNPVIT